MNIVTCFQEVVGDFVLPFTEEENMTMAKRATELKEKGLMSHQWYCNTCSTIGSTHNILEDPIFTRLIVESTKAAALFAEAFDLSGKIECKDGWVNYAEPGAFQEFHDHPSRHFSSVYYISADKNAGDIMFKSHAAFSNMFELPNKDTVPLNFNHYYFEPIPSRFLVFRSNLQHMVAINKSNKPRIGASFNYVIQPTTKN